MNNSYAPVYIPTLNRFNHFKACLESLERCTGAKKTEVYIGVDFPPSVKYEDGYNKINSYLEEKKNKHGFLKLEIIKRKKNCGVNNPNSNGMLLQKYVSSFSDSFIMSEDDNVFSPNFLEYMNECLKKYENDPNCLAVCGYNYYKLNLDSYKKNVFFSHEFSAWGVGFWKKKQEKLAYIKKFEYTKSIISTWKNIITIYRHEPRLLHTVMLNIATGYVFSDTMLVCYQYLNNCYSVFPKISKVRNQGFDNSGVTIFKKDDNYMQQKIDNSKSFNLDSIITKVDTKAQKEVELFFKRSFLMNLIILIRISLYKIFKIDICYFEMKRRNKKLFK